ncbi:MAG TPA: dUTP diphosphatase [Clostridiales bacterium]|nr:dUTP diphosphatase [Clostridiales bacterium]HCG34780.1 dUTP diphosphatase [Clostridiales bacterium]
MKLKLKKMCEKAVLPQYMSESAAAMDVCACLDQPVILEAGQRVLISTGIAIAPESNQYVALVCARSGLASKYGISLANGIGVIDADYRGEIKVALVNLSNQSFTVENGMRIAQLMILSVCHAQVEETDTLDETARGAGGFGSTGTQSWKNSF